MNKENRFTISHDYIKFKKSDFNVIDGSCILKRVDGSELKMRYVENDIEFNGKRYGVFSPDPNSFTVMGIEGDVLIPVENDKIIEGVGSVYMNRIEEGREREEEEMWNKVQFTPIKVRINF